jgi:hypothetical protein
MFLKPGVATHSSVSLKYFNCICHTDYHWDLIKQYTVDAA